MLAPGRYWQNIDRETAIYYDVARVPLAAGTKGWVHVPAWVATTRDNVDKAINDAAQHHGAHLDAGEPVPLGDAPDDFPRLDPRTRSELGNPADSEIWIVPVFDRSEEG